MGLVGTEYNPEKDPRLEKMLGLMREQSDEFKRNALPDALLNLVSGGLATPATLLHPQAFMRVLKTAKATGADPTTLGAIATELVKVPVSYLRPVTDIAFDPRISYRGAKGTYNLLSNSIELSPKFKSARDAIVTLWHELTHVRQQFPQLGEKELAKYNFNLERLLKKELTSKWTKILGGDRTAGFTAASDSFTKRYKKLPSEMHAFGLESFLPGSPAEFTGKIFRKFHKPMLGTVLDRFGENIVREEYLPAFRKGSLLESGMPVEDLLNNIRLTLYRESNLIPQW